MKEGRIPSGDLRKLVVDVKKPKLKKPGLLLQLSAFLVPGGPTMLAYIELAQQLEQKGLAGQTGSKEVEDSGK